MFVVGLLLLFLVLLAAPSAGAPVAGVHDHPVLLVLLDALLEPLDVLVLVLPRRLIISEVAPLAQVDGGAILQLTVVDDPMDIKQTI